ncbi:MAG: LacI family transcriptional regulator [Rhodovulum sulfidophilum]|uniref:LacI family transcriptional regulator n=1 Tax=Rhodovulum sulfidophilum TaxID=35806 RepID=A0A2W5MZ46_RHOSU|nr:MAG: LacI family transcriptional regulator [Rhodovulum sulfidophilum]
MEQKHERRVRRGPSVSEVAEAAGVGTATVDRVLNACGTVAPGTRLRVLEALDALRGPEPKRRRVVIVCESGDSFNRALAEAVGLVARRRRDLDLEVEVHSSFNLSLLAFSQRIERAAETADALIIVARANPHVVRASRATKRRGKPVVCLATDLPRACRHGYVGSDEESAGRAAAKLMGDLIHEPEGRVLFIACGGYQASAAREKGFAEVLAHGFPNLRVDHWVEVRNDPDLAYAEVLRYARERGAPQGIYSIAGGNSGVGRALAELGVAREVVFIGHELNAHSRALLASGEMNYLLARDQEQELMLGLTMIDAILSGRPHLDREERQIRIVCEHTRG